MRILVREHAIDRAMDENRFYKSRPTTREKARKGIVRAVEFSFLLKLNPDGSELRGHNGKIYVCRNKKGSKIVYTILKSSRLVD